MLSEGYCGIEQYLMFISYFKIDIITRIRDSGFREDEILGSLGFSFHIDSCWLSSMFWTALPDVCFYFRISNECA